VYLEIYWYDLLIWLAYATIALLCLSMYRHSRKEDYYKFFITGFWIKILGGLAFSLIFNYYYCFGDTFLYYVGGHELAGLLTESPSDYFRMLASESGHLPADLAHYAAIIDYSDTFEEWFMVKLISPIVFISFDSYITCNLFMSFLSFLGAWKLFQVYNDILPERKLQGFIFIFCMPSVVFWGGGLMKDTVALCGLNYLIYYCYFMTTHRKNLIKYSVFALIWVIVIFKLKSYIVIAFLPGVMMYLYFHFRQKIESKLIKAMISPILFSVMLVIGYFGVISLSDKSEKYKQEELTGKISGFHSWHTDLGGSTYDLGVEDLSTASIVGAIPAALNVTFFRPYLWEADGLVVMIGALEGLTFLLLFIRMLWLCRMNFFKYLRENPFLMGMFFYILLFGFAVGFTSYNFGALARYKIPIISLFGIALMYVSYKAAKARESENQPSRRAEIAVS